MYQYFISDGRGCDTVLLMDTHSCPCITEAGEISINDADLCTDESLEVSYDGSGGAEDDNDAIEYILRDGMGNVIQRNITGTFSYDDGLMNLGEVYTVRVYVGDPAAGGTEVDLAEECMDSTNGEDVVWYAYPEAEITAGAPMITCTIEEIILDASESTPKGEVDFAWEALGNGAIKAGEEMSPRPTITAGGTYRVTVTHTVSGCSDVGSIEIGQSEDVPVIALADYGKLNCSRKTITLDASGSSQSSNIKASWVNPADETIDSAAGSYTLTVSEPGVYKFELRDTLNDCDVSREIPVEEDVAEPTAVASVDAMLDCTTREVTVSGEGSAEGDTYSYRWRTTGGNIVGSETTIAITADAVGTYVLEVKNTENGCIGVDSVRVEENPAALSNIDVSTTGLVCKDGQPGTIRVEALNGTAPYTYTLSPGETNSAGVFTELEPGIYDLRVVDALGCAVDTTVELTAPTDFTAEFMDAVRIDEGDSATIYFTSVSDSLSEVRWEVEGEYRCLNSAGVCDSIRVTGEQLNSQLIEAILINTDGCIIERAIQLFVVENRDVYIPNAFSPNEDGANDVWTIGAGPKVVGVKDVVVYDRWGERLYELESAEVEETLEMWNGRYNGEPMRPDVFMYKMTVIYDDGEQIQFSGDITLLK